MIPPSASRVYQQTEPHVNRAIHRRSEADIAYYAERPEQIDARLEELDREWDIERLLEANAATLAFFGTALSATISRKWLWLPAGVTAFLLQHAVQGWCPPVGVFRRLGFRTPREIEAERCALKVLRGDFREIPPGREGVDATVEAVGRLEAAR